VEWEELSPAAGGGGESLTGSGSGYAEGYSPFFADAEAQEGVEEDSLQQATAQLERLRIL
jgi:hypothetical protein